MKNFVFALSAYFLFFFTTSSASSQSFPPLPTLNYLDGLERSGVEPCPADIAPEIYACEFLAKPGGNRLTHVIVSLEIRPGRRGIILEIWELTPGSKPRLIYREGDQLI